MLILIKNNGGMVTLDSVWISCIVPVSVVRSITTCIVGGSSFCGGSGGTGGVDQPIRNHIMLCICIPAKDQHLISKNLFYYLDVVLAKK